MNFPIIIAKIFAHKKKKHKLIIAKLPNSLIKSKLHIIRVHSILQTSTNFFPQCCGVLNHIVQLKLYIELSFFHEKISLCNTCIFFSKINPQGMIILGVYIHCEGCANEVLKYLRGFEGLYLKNDDHMQKGCIYLYANIDFAVFYRCRWGRN